MEVISTLALGEPVVPDAVQQLLAVDTRGGSTSRYSSSRGSAAVSSINRPARRTPSVTATSFRVPGDV
jgi:hypothetical protein